MPSIMAVLGANISPFVNSLQRAKNEAASAGAGIAGNLTSGLGGKLMGFASVAALEQIVEKTVEYGSKINDLSLRLGVSTDAVQQWDYALKQNGSSIDTGARFFEKLAVARQKALGGNENAIASFTKLGVSMQQLQGSRLEDIGASIQRAFETGDPQALISDLREVGGKGAGEMIAAFRSGFGELMSEAPLISADDIAKLDELGDKWQELKSGAMAAIAGPIVALMTIVQGMMFGIERLIAIMIGGVKGFGEHMGNTWDKLKGGNVVGAFHEFTVGGPAGVLKGVGDALQALDDADTLKSDKADERRLKRRGPVDLEAQEAESKKTKAANAAEAAARTHRAHMDHTLKLEETLGKKQQENSLKKLSTAKQIEELERRRAGLEEDVAKMRRRTGQQGTDAELEKRIAIADVDKDLMDARKRLKTDEEQALGKYSLSREARAGGAHQAIGGFLGNYSMSAEAAVLEVNKKSEKHLDAIRKALERRGITPASDDAQF